MHILLDGVQHEITPKDFHNEVMEALKHLVVAAEEVNALYNAHLYNRVFDIKAFDKLLSALSQQSRALMNLRGPDHDPHDWAQFLDYHEPR